MQQTLAALEFDRLLQLVASFARSQQGRTAVLATLPRFEPAEGSRAFSLTRELWDVIERCGALSFAGLDAVELLASGSPPLPDGKQLSRLAGLVRRVVEVRDALAAAGSLGETLARLHASLPDLAALLAFCDQRLGLDGEVLDSASPALAQARAGRERHRHAAIAALEQIARRQHGIVGPMTVRRERYCLPIAASERERAPGLVLDVSSSASTLFVEPLAVVELNNALTEAIALARGEEERVLTEVAAAISRRHGELTAGASCLRELDAFQARVLFGKSCGAVLLQPGGAARLHLERARHPLLEPSLAQLRGAVLGEPGNIMPVVPLDLEADDRARVILLSGPNAGGKTVVLKTVGVTVLMAQAAIPVLVGASSELPTFSRVWCHVGDEQNLLSDLSTFSAAMQATAALLAEADDSTLVLYDELGSGTDPEEGAALAAALLEELLTHRCWAIATAHLLTVAAHLEELPGAVNAAMGFDESDGRPTYRLTMGVPGRSRGLAIAQRCGVPARVLQRAREMLSRGFLAIDAHLGRLEAERQRLELARQAAVGSQAEAEEAREQAEESRSLLEAERHRLEGRLAQERERLRLKAREQLAAAIAELQRARERGEFPGKRRLAAVRHIALDLEEGPGPVAPAVPLAAGDAVRLVGSSTIGSVIRVLGDRVEVAIGDKRLWADAGDCEITTPPDARHPAVTTSSVPEDTATELKLLGLTQEEAREQLERFLDRALLAGNRHVRIVHGHGSGTLRRLVREVLGSHPSVARFSHPPQGRGGTGVTEAELE